MKASTIARAVACGSLFFSWAACGDDAPASNTSDRACVPGATASCTCTNGEAGAQTCAEDGASFGACVCDGLDPNPDPDQMPDPNAEPEPDPTPDPRPDMNPDPGPGQGDCPTDLFLNLGDFEGPGGDHPDPVLEVSCTEDTLVVVSNGIPHYEFMSITPNGLQAQNLRFEIPLEPELSEDSTTIPLLGAVGFSISGMPIFGPNEAERPDPYGDPIYNDIVDWCLGHTGMGGAYHLHALLEECFTTGEPLAGPSPVLGFSLDGFPIYGSRGCADADCDEIVTFQSSWEQIGDPTTYAWDNNACNRPECEVPAGNFLDECNGHVGPRGDYHYHATETFPYALGCYRGVVGDQGGDNNMPGECQDDNDCAGDCSSDLGCQCVQTPLGDQRCHQACNNDDDCATDGIEGSFCGREGLCIPRMM